MKIKIALFGGAFNPIGLHHENIANKIKSTGMDIWFMPCHQHRFNKNASLVDEVHRLNMTQIVANEVGASVCDFEIKHKLNGSTFEVMSKLESTLPDMDFHLIVGLDNAQIIETQWDRGSELIKKYPFIVVDRPGVELNVDWFQKSPHIILNNGSVNSSTDIRNLIKEKRYDEVKSYLNPKVWQYIIDHSLFGYEDHG